MVPQPAFNQTHKPSDKKGRIIIFFLRWAGIGLLILAVLATIELVQLRVYGIEASGHVIRQEIEKEKITERVYGIDTRLEFDRYNAVVSVMADDSTYTIRSHYGGRNAPLYPTGTQLTVVYCPEHPEKARIQQEMS